MTISSDQLELFLERLNDLNKVLTKLKSEEVRKIEIITEIKSISRDWLRYSEALRAVEALPVENLKTIDSEMNALFQSTNIRTRASAYQKRINAVVSSFTERVVIPVIRFEGSPSQVASRQLLSEFIGKVSPEEQIYLEEAARCLSCKGNRAAIIMLWAAAVSRLHQGIEKIGFNAYNTALDKIVQKKGQPFIRVSKTQIASLPELQRGRDFDVIVVGMELWKYDLQVYEELDRLLGIRNSAAHPGMLKPTALDVLQYASKLSTYVFGIVQG